MFTRRPAVPSRRAAAVPSRGAWTFNFFCTMLGFILGPVQRKKTCSFFKHHDSSFFNRKLFTDFEWFLRSFNINPIFDTEFSSCVRFFDQKRAAIWSQASFQKNDSPSRETALDEKKWGIAAVALKFLKTCLGTCRNTGLTMFLRSVRNFSIEDRV